MREVITTDRELTTSEIRRVQLRQRNVVHKLGYVVVSGNRRRKRVTTFHHIGDLATTK